MSKNSDTRRFAIFRATDPAVNIESTVMELVPFSPTAAEGAKRVLEAGLDHGTEQRVVFQMPGFSLVYAWFKSEFPLPRHTHNCDCLYYIVGGSLRIGTEELSRGDGFFVGKDVPYTYTPGPAGVEVLEFRATNAFDIKLLADSPLFWDGAVKTVLARRSTWTREQPPSSLQ
jgi:hypothetical protein